MSVILLVKGLDIAKSLSFIRLHGILGQDRDLLMINHAAVYVKIIKSKLLNLLIFFIFI